MLIYLTKAAEVVTEPLEVGEARFNLVDVVSRAQHAPFTAGVAEIWKSAPVDFEYDDDGAVCYMLEGEITLSSDGKTYSFLPGDIVYIAQTAGLVVLWSTESYGKFFYVTYPHWR